MFLLFEGSFQWLMTECHKALTANLKVDSGPLFCLGLLDEEALREPSTASYKWLDPILCLVRLSSAMSVSEWDSVCLRDPHEVVVHITGDTAWVVG
ncbi:hypothetical protein CRENBAI_017447 [Crenichthys baileyi]|uniref:Uncharacterized protein n=1 Tax=Crenichthys baileyi TaxID=28760 RepID=A0AAV9R8K8_9TELE